MRGLLAVARREFLEKRFVFAAAAAASLVPFAVPLVRGLHGESAAEARDWTALLLAATFGAALTLALGFSILSKDQADRRIGFFFSRPLSGFSLWAGKLAGALLIVYAAAAIIYGPTLLVNGRRILLVDLPTETPWVFLGGAVVLLLVCHALGVAVRSRSAWIVLDFAALVALALGIVAARGLPTMRVPAFPWEPVALALVLFGGLAVAGLRSVARGRTDIRAAHRALSISLWSIVGIGGAALAGYIFWALSAGPADLKEVEFARPAASGSWVIVQGPARGYFHSFLFDTSSSRFQRCGGWALISPDGRRAAWLDGAGSGKPVDVVTLDLADSASKPVRTRIVLPATPSLAFLSSGGERIATISRDFLSVYDLASGASLGSARIGPRGIVVSGGFFLDQGRLRLFRTSFYPHAPGTYRMDILEFDTSAKRLAVTGALDDVNWMAFNENAAGDRLVARGKNEGITLRDGRSGARLATLWPANSGASGWGRFLSDGRIAVGVHDSAGARVQIFSSDGKPERALPLSLAGPIAFGGEAAAGKLVIAAGGKLSDRGGRTIFLADLSSGEVRRVTDHLFPAVFMATVIGPHYLPAPGSEAAKLFYGPRGSLVRFDAVTGARRVILPASSR